jgi:hypothetical protein
MLQGQFGEVNGSLEVGGILQKMLVRCSDELRRMFKDELLCLLNFSGPP